MTAIGGGRWSKLARSLVFWLGRIRWSRLETMGTSWPTRSRASGGNALSGIASNVIRVLRPKLRWTGPISVALRFRPMYGWTGEVC